MNNFTINPNFNTSGFNDSIDNYNKVFSNSLNQTDKAFGENSSFSVVMDNISAKQKEPLEAGVQYFEDAETLKQQSTLSPVAKMVKDIGSGFSNSINELNTIDKKAETDFETFAAGGDISVHEVMISAQKSNLAMQMAIQLRNQMINAYNEFKNMSV